MPRSRCRSRGPLMIARARRTAMYSKNERTPPVADNPWSDAMMLSTWASEKLFNGKPETIRS